MIKISRTEKYWLASNALRIELQLTQSQANHNLIFLTFINADNNFHIYWAQFPFCFFLLPRFNHFCACYGCAWRWRRRPRLRLHCLAGVCLCSGWLTSKIIGNWFVIVGDLDCMFIGAESLPCSASMPFAILSVCAARCFLFVWMHRLLCAPNETWSLAAPFPLIFQPQEFQSIFTFLLPVYCGVAVMLLCVRLTVANSNW